MTPPDDDRDPKTPSASRTRPRSRSNPYRNNNHKPRPRPFNFLAFHKPARLPSATRTQPTLKPPERKCLKNLAAYRPPKWARKVHRDVESSLASSSSSPSSSSHHHPPLPLPLPSLASVLIALFIGRHGDLYVLLSKRSSALRTFAGDTSLPGGKVDATAGDRTVEDTARREAFEEIGLPVDKGRSPLLCVVEPFVVGEEVVVTPVVVLITDRTLRPILNHTEVSSLFSHPLRSFLSTTAPTPSRLSPSKSKSRNTSNDDNNGAQSDAEDDEYASIEALAFSEYYSYHDVPWAGDRMGMGKRGRDTKAGKDGRDVKDEKNGKNGERREKKRKKEKKSMIRMHRFLTGREAGGVKPVYGLTAAILIHIASIGYARSPEFDVEAPGQPGMEERVGRVVERVRREAQAEAEAEAQERERVRELERVAEDKEREREHERVRVVEEAKTRRDEDAPRKETKEATFRLKSRL